MKMPSRHTHISKIGFSVFGHFSYCLSLIDPYSISKQYFAFEGFVVYSKIKCSLYNSFHVIKVTSFLQ